LTIAAYVFDLDGTLACLPVNWETLFEEFKRIMNVDVVRPLVDTISKVSGKTRDEVFYVWDRAEAAAIKGTTFCVEGKTLYHEAEGKPKALVTLQGKKTVDAIVNKFGLTFDVVITREDTLFRSDQLLMAAQKLNVLIQDIMFVGNAETDETAAKKVGCQFHRVK
jgi:beta-phosphoglucomutase-like phosphatase (HAD superfamily)